MPNPRPRYLNLLEIRLPVPAFVSIVHRVTGVALFLLLPLMLYLLQLSLESPESFAVFKNAITQPLMKLVLIGLVWAYMHHFCAGIRHLALDLHHGVSLEASRVTSWAVLGVSTGMAAVFGVLIW